MSVGSIEPIRLELPTNFAVGPVNTYLFLEPEPILIDAGVDNVDSWLALVDGLAKYNLAISDLKKVIITHPHSDHFGQAYKIADLGGAQVFCADLGVDWLLNPRQKFQNRIDFYRDYFLPSTGASEEMVQTAVSYLEAVRDTTTPLSPEKVTPFKVGDTLLMGQLPWQVLHMPGHASHQTCFYQPNTQQFISADMLLPITPTPIVECPPDGKTRQPALPFFMESLARLEALPIEIVYPGHGEPFANPNEVIARQRSRIGARKDECWQLVQDGMDTAVALVDEMYQNYPIQLRPAGLWMLIGYLDLLQNEGKIVTQQDGKLIRYKAV